MQAAVTRRCSSGNLHAPEQAATLDEALRAHTVNAAFALGREHEIGSIEVGKLADFVELDADPYAVVPDKIGAIGVLGTWLGGSRIDLGEFAAASHQVDDAAFAQLRTYGVPACCHLPGADA